jgi:ATP-dependent helicase HrpA
MGYFAELESQIATAMQADRHRLRNMLRAVVKAEEDGREPGERLDKLLAQIEDSNRRREAREKLVPKLIYDDALPIVARREEIAAAIRDNPVVIVCGETGSGKSTQLPKICLEIGLGVAGLIGHTQPRRIAARSIASRLAEELGTSVGQKVGFKIRFTDATGPQTLVKIMTDGVLLAESQHDRYFDQYDTLIIDEAHERSLNIDFLLGYLKRLLTQRRDLRVIITSATIDAERFAAHFDKAPVIEVSGRTYPVEVLYRPLSPDEGTDQIDPIRGVADAVEEVCRLGGGDVLVFLPTERHILEASHKLRGRNLPGGKPDILPLYARLSTAEQNRVFQPHSARRIVLATNVAESSLTVPGIRYVVDSGTARISRYSARSKLQRLPIERISQASADQRKGRCGRIGPGVCVRLFDEDDYLSRDKFMSPEIQRTNLAAVILQLLALDLGSIDDFPFLDPPRAEAIRDGYKTLFELNAIDEQRKLLPLGRQLARLPVDPRIGRMIVEANREHCLADVMIIAAALEVQDPRERPADRQQDADNAHAQWTDQNSDFLAWLKLWDFVQHLKQQTTRSGFRKACQQNFLSEVRLREWQEVHRQLLEMVQQAGMHVGKRIFVAAAAKDNAIVYASIHRSLLAGLLSSVAQRGETSEYTAAGGGKFQLWPGSGAFAAKPKWIVAAEMVETTRRYLRTVARIDPDWIEPLAAHLVNRSYSDPHWDRRAGGAMAAEKVSLLGLTIVPRRRVRYTAIDPKVSRQLFIEHGLARGDYDTKAEFFARNQRLVREIEELAAKTRRRDLVVEAQLVADFYASRLPRAVIDHPSLEKWRREAEKENRRLLFLTEADLLGNQPATVNADQYPDDLQIDRLKLPLVYHFEPGAEQDGVTVTVPRAGVAQLSEERLGWLVPGLVADKVEALIRSLPKALRRNLGAAPELARRIAGEIAFASAPLPTLVAAALSKHSGEKITADMFDEQRLPPHLRMKIRVIDHGGRTVVEGRDLAAIREHLGEDAAPPPPEQSPWHRDGITRWDFGPLPEHLDLPYGGLTLTRHPAVVDAHRSVSLRLLESPAEANHLTRMGLLRLFVLAEHRELKAQVQWLPQIERLRLFGAPLAKSRSIDDQLIDLLACRAFYAADAVPRDPDSFEVQRLAGRRNIVPAVQETTKLAQSLLAAYHDVRLVLEQPRPSNCQPALTDIRQQLAALLPEDFLTSTPWNWLVHFPRFLKAIELRLKKLTTGGLDRDRHQLALLAPRQEALAGRFDPGQWATIEDPRLAHYRWLLEELRVSLFAQELGTSEPVSPQRLDKALPPPA